MANSKSDAESGGQILSWVGQTVLAYFAPLVGVFLLSAVFGEKDTLAWRAIDYVAFAALGVAAGISISVLAPDSVVAGRWAWVAPLGLLTCCIAWDVSLGRSSVLSTALFGAGEAAWVSVLVAMPTWGCCWYSLVMAVICRRNGLEFR